MVLDRYYLRSLVPNMLVLVQGWYCLRSYQPGRVLHTSLDPRRMSIYQTETDLNSWTWIGNWMEFVDMQDFYYSTATQIFTNVTLGSMGLCYQQITALRSFMSKQRLNSEEELWCAHCIRTHSDIWSAQTSSGMKENYKFPGRPVCSCWRKLSVYNPWIQIFHSTIWCTSLGKFRSQ
jgi:hypothetical protein